MMTMLIVLAAIGGSGCAAFGPQRLRCVSKMVPLYWADGTETSLPMNFCGYNAKVRK